MPIKQAGVVPYKIENKITKVLLITSTKGHWTLPKGIVEPEEIPEIAAKREAFEEAGIKGVIGSKIGAYTRKKWGEICFVTFYTYEVKHYASTFLENGFRKRQWMNIEYAIELVKSKHIKKILIQSKEKIESSQPDNINF